MKNARLQAYMRAAMQNCPTENDLVEFHRGRMSPDRTEEIRVHLSGCPACRRIQQDVQIFFEEDSSVSPSKELEQDFRSLWNRIQAEAEPSPAATSNVTVLPSASVRRRPFGVQFLAVAAAVLLAVGGLSWGVWWRQQLDRQYQMQLSKLSGEIQGLRAQVEMSQRLNGPKLNVRLIELFSATSVRGERGIGAAEVKNSDGGELVFILNGHDAGDAASYRIELRDKDGRLLWQNESLKREETGNFIVSMPAGYLKSGKYRVWLKHGNSTLTYDFELKE